VTTAAGLFWKAIPEARWPEDEEAVCEELDTCLLTDEELLAGKASWLKRADPFPVIARTVARRT
jgi:hypothetical protein